jgi:hypothetical protein
MTTAAREDEEFWLAVDRAVAAQATDRDEISREGIGRGDQAPVPLTREQMAAAFRSQIATFNTDYGTAGYNPNAIHPVTGQRKTGTQLTSN